MGIYIYIEDKTSIYVYLGAQRNQSGGKEEILDDFELNSMESRRTREREGLGMGQLPLGVAIVSPEGLL